MTFIQKVQGRRINKKPQIVTYDWLEDSIDSKKPIQGTEKYDPGQTRDVDGMVTAWKEAKFSAKASVDGTAKPSSKKKPAGADEHEMFLGSLDTDVANEGVAKVGATSSSGAKLGQRNQTVASSSTNKPTTAHTTRQPNKEPPPKPIIEVYKDKTDQFPYCIELTLVRPDPEVKADKQVVEVSVWANREPSLFRSQASLYKNGKKLCELSPVRWVCDVKEVLDGFTAHFRRKTGYAWDERLLRAGTKGGNGGRWLYEVPAPGTPTGATRPEYTPGHPKCLNHQAGLLPIAARRPGNLLGWGKPLPSHKMTAAAAAFKKRADSDPPKQKTHKKTLVTLPKPQKRKFGECSSFEHRAKVQKTVRANGEACNRATKR